ncbi:PEST proteolytic signal-containing nuclear protein-like [Danaus plexippus]|uniref:PEST proteolytic signal-containing nuclear protein n=1 Tax=Danaus plexippus plexippus TaxID=278856 RepID=A0A212EUX4_DANPL|nr:PEST proteolytic signal-containing nuclear protein-like [Danaus plexippus]OWR45283.1 hypothetical protein KGM_213211 [Danaus plexippus plexippus]
MSDRYREHKGSSRTRDDSRKHKEREARRTRSRSRSPRRRRVSPSGHRGSPSRPGRSRERNLENADKRRYSESWEESDEEVPAPPPPPRISKISIDFSKPKAPIKMTLGATSKPAPKPTVASVFNADDDDEPEEMPAEARMRMRNIGRETPTSAGPNSFGKTKQGFCDAKKVFEKNLKQALETADKPSVKFPQTIYKIKP